VGSRMHNVQRPTVPAGPMGTHVLARGVAMHVEGDSLLIGRHVHHTAFSLADTHSSQSDEEEVGQ
jgi:hypothetical protein